MSLEGFGILVIMVLVIGFIFFTGYSISNQNLVEFKKQAIEANVAYYHADSRTGESVWIWRTNNAITNK